MLTLSQISPCDLLDTFVVIDSLPRSSDCRVLMLPLMPSILIRGCVKWLSTQKAAVRKVVYWLMLAAIE
jgi:hypothetical protein